MSNMEEISAKLRQLEEKNARREKVAAMLADLYAQRTERQAKVRETAVVLRKEQGDVDKLERHSLKGLLLSLTGNKEERLNRERQEAVTARLQHDQAVQDLEWLKDEIARLSSEQEQLNDVLRQLEQTRAMKAALLLAQGGETGRRMEELEEQISRVRAQKKELDEALSAGRTAASALVQVLRGLDGAERMGTWDLLGGGIFTTLAKHDRIKEARGDLAYAQQALARFRAELADVDLSVDPQVEIGQFATFADYFFDGIIADWVVQAKIRNAQNSVEQARSRVMSVIGRLEGMRATAQKEFARLEQERNALLSGL